MSRSIADEWGNDKLSLLTGMIKFLFNADCHYYTVNNRHFQIYINDQHLFTIDKEELLKCDDEMIENKKFWEIIYWLESYLNI